MEKKDYVQILDALDKLYNNAWKPLHQDISDYVLFRRGNFIERGKPYDPKNVYRSGLVINDCATRSMRILGSGLQGGLCSPSRRWCRLTLQDTDLAAFPPMKAWLQYVEDAIYKVYAGSNFYTEIHRTFEEQGGFGTCPLLQEEDDLNVVRFSVATAGEYRLAQNEKGEVDTMYRHYWRTARELARKFGENVLTDATKNLLKTNKHEYVEVVHCISPRESYDPTMENNVNFPFESIWFEAASADDKFLRIGGYREQPFVAPRWGDVGNSAYGLGPGHDIIGNVKMIQEMEKTILKASHKEVDPPMAYSSKFKDVLNTLPGGRNWFDGEDYRYQAGPLYTGGYNLHNANEKIMEMEKRIERTCYNDIFTMIINAEAVGRQITATEILERKEEKLVLLGPTVERQTTDLFDPLIRRTFWILYRRGMIPPPPEDILFSDLKIKYTGVLAQAQRLSDAQAMRVYADEAIRVREQDPMTVFKTDWDEYLGQFGEIVGVPQDVIRSKDEAGALRDEYIAAQEEREKAEKEQQAILAMKEMSRADTSGGNALTDVAEAAASGG